MKIKNNISFWKLIHLLQMGVIYNSQLDNLPLILRIRTGLKLIKLPDSAMDVSFRQFIEALKYIDSIQSSILLIHKLTGLSINSISSGKAVRIYPIYKHYSGDIARILDMFAEINDEMPSSKRTVKTMEEFGLTNIVNYLADGRIELHDYIFDKPVSWVYIEYRRKSHQYLNELSNIKANDTNLK